MCASWSGQRDYNRRFMRARRLLRGHASDDVAPSSSSSEHGESDIEDLVVNDVREESCSETPEPEEELASDNAINVDDDHDDSGDDWADVNSDSPITSESNPEDDSDHSDEELQVSLPNRLATWVNDHQVKHNAVDGLLKILQVHGHPELPSTARTLLQTSKNVETSVVSGMEYIYLGVTEQVTKAYKICRANIVDDADAINLALNIDGIPLHKDTSKSLWPILCSITNASPAYVFPLALTYGHSKPDNLDFVIDTVRDLDVILINGLFVDGEHFQVNLKCIVCDAPAKAMVKGIKLYSGYNGCDKCDQHGEWKGRMTYPETVNFQKRTNESFRAQANPGHHKTDSPFTQLPMDMVKGFPIDYMHQSCLGVMKKLILIWMRGKGALRIHRIGAGQIQTISETLLELKKSIPSEFQRKPRHLSEIDRWKATELRQFLLYTGKVCLKDTLTPAVYNHFMALSVATCILVNKTLASQHHAFAEELMVYFNNQGRVLYGQEFLVYNVHSMVHLADEAREYGDLNVCAAFAFENYLQFMKKLVRSGKRPIVQIVKRLEEKERFRDPPTPRNTPVVSAKKPNNCYILSESSCCEVREETNERSEDGEQLFLCRIYKNSENAYTEPCDSKVIGVHKVNRRNTTMQMIPYHRLNRKALMFEVERNIFIFMALLHCY